MHAPPSVSYPVGRSAFAARAYGGLALLGLLAAAAWALQTPGSWRPVAGFAAVLASAAFAGLAWYRGAAGMLRWDGREWHWEEGGAAWVGTPELALDLQSRMLLRFRPHAGPVRWLWLERSSDPSHWDALRRAVYSRASAPIPAFPQGGKEPPPAGKPPAAEQ